MLAFVIRRLLQALLVMLVVALIAFTLFRFVGDPINQMVGIETSVEDRARLREVLGLNDPLPVQFGRFVWNALHFDFGISYQFKTPVIRPSKWPLSAPYQLLAEFSATPPTKGPEKFGFVAKRTDTGDVYVVFRGTQTIGDWLATAWADRSPPCVRLTCERPSAPSPRCMRSPRPARVIKASPTSSTRSAPTRGVSSTPRTS